MTVYGGLNAFFLLMDKPEAYNLPERGQRRAARAATTCGGYLGCS